jgi:hypothetical protein
MDITKPDSSGLFRNFITKLRPTNVSHGHILCQARTREIHKLTKAKEFNLEFPPKQAKANKGLPTLRVRFKSHKKLKGQDTRT